MNNKQCHFLRQEVREMINQGNFKYFIYQGRMRLARRQNEEMFGLLDKLNMFNFHITNSGKSVYLYQIQAFIKKNGGWKMVKEAIVCQKDQLEIHHLDHNTLNDQPGNLEYVSPELNKLATQFTKAALKGNVEKVKELVVRKFQNKFVELDGLKISFVSIIVKTILATKEATKEMGGDELIGFVKKVIGYRRSFSAKEMLRNFKASGETHKKVGRVTYVSWEWAVEQGLVTE